MNRNYSKWIILWTFVLFVSCIKDDIPIQIANRTVIVYMIADNNLDYFADLDINEMEKGWNNKLDGNLIVYVDRAKGSNPSHPIILEIQSDTTNQIISPVKKVFPEINSCDSTNINRILSDIISEYPSKSYGLILWSHGSSWYPVEANPISFDNFQGLNSTRQKLPLVKAFGNDEDKGIDIKSLDAALPIKFDFLLFDACFMGGIEVVYELRRKADYIIASPAEILSYGFPYDRILPLLFQPTIDFSRVGEEYIDFYNQQTGVLSTGTISIISTKYLDQVVRICRDVSYGRQSSNNSASFQQFGNDMPNKYFDFFQVESSLAKNQNEINQIDSVLNKVILFKKSTTLVFGKKLNHYSGLSVFFPSDSFKYLRQKYEELSWSKDSGFSNWAYN